MCIYQRCQSFRLIVLLIRLTSDVQDFKSSFKICISQGLRSVTQVIVTLVCVSNDIECINCCMLLDHWMFLIFILYFASFDFDVGWNFASHCISRQWNWEGSSTDFSKGSRSGN